MDAREKLIVDALRFAVWAAGEGISPVDGPVEPETFLFDYATATGDEDYDTLPDRLLADSALIHRDENHGPTLERAAAMAENLGGTWSGSRDVSVCVQEAAVDDKCEDIAAAIRAMEVKHHG